MRLPLLVLAALSASVQAFMDTSPFLIVSSTTIPKESSSTGLGSKREVMQHTKSMLALCTSDIYIFISQPEMAIQDIAFSPFLRTIVEAKTAGNGGIAARELLGMDGSEGEELAAFVERRCAGFRREKIDGKERGRSVVLREFQALVRVLEDREEMVREHDAAIQSTLQSIPQGTPYTLIYLTTPPPPLKSEPTTPQYSPEFASEEALHQDLKRNVISERAPPRGKGPYSDQRPLFEQYMFLSPGLFMGLLVGVLLLAILSVGVGALGSLRVSYAAFEKDMGPAAQKKTQ